MRILGLMAAGVASMVASWAQAASAVVQNTNVIAGADVGASAPSFWYHPDGSWNWFGAPMLGLAAVLVLLWLWRRRR